MSPPPVHLHSADFFRYARERHNLYLLRRLGQDAPWTTDPVLNTYSFTNVYRELDRTTTWFRHNLRDRLKGRREVVPWTVIFRWFNRISTGEVIREFVLSEAHIQPFDPELLGGMIRRALPKGPWVTGSYVIRSPAGFDKLAGVLEWCGEFCDWWDDKGQYEFFNGADTPVLNMQQAHRLIAAQRGLSDFMAYEVVCDLRWAGAVVPTDRHKWAHAGPGATRGGSRVKYGQPNCLNQTNLAHQGELRNLMGDLLRMSRMTEYWPQGDGDWPEWEMREVEHTLCEFDKYERARREQGRPKRLFNPIGRPPLPDPQLGGL